MSLLNQLSKMVSNNQIKRDVYMEYLGNKGLLDRFMYMYDKRENILINFNQGPNGKTNDGELASPPKNYGYTKKRKIENDFKQHLNEVEKEVSIDTVDKYITKTRNSIENWKEEDEKVKQLFLTTLSEEFKKLRSYVRNRLTELKKLKLLRIERILQEWKYWKNAENIVSGSNLMKLTTPPEFVKNIERDVQIVYVSKSILSRDCKKMTFEISYRCQEKASVLGVLFHFNSKILKFNKLKYVLSKNWSHNADAVKKDEEERKEKKLPTDGWMVNEERKAVGYDPYPNYNGSIVKDSNQDQYGREYEGKIIEFKWLPVHPFGAGGYSRAHFPTYPEWQKGIFSSKESTQWLANNNFVIAEIVFDIIDEKAEKTRIHFTSNEKIYHVIRSKREIDFGERVVADEDYNKNPVKIQFRGRDTDIDLRSKGWTAQKIADYSKKNPLKTDEDIYDLLWSDGQLDKYGNPLDGEKIDKLLVDAGVIYFNDTVEQVIEEIKNKGIKSTNALEKFLKDEIPDDDIPAILNNDKVKAELEAQKKQRIFERIKINFNIDIGILSENAETDRLISLLEIMELL